MDIPRDKDFPPEAVQCDGCGGWGCDTCDQRGWLTPRSHPNGRKCLYAGCRKPLAPNYKPLYCSNNCASKDA